MCGIAGLTGRGDREPLEAAMARMAASMEHRGPDDEGIEIARAPGGGSVGLCTRRLAIQDCSPAGHQPMTSPRTGNLIAFNGELYNVDPLRDELAGRGHSFRGSSDTEVALYAYDEWGLDCLRRFRGMFGLALYHAPTGKLTLARDRLGIKPLYYGTIDGRLVYASELRTALASGIVDTAVSAQGIRSFLTLGAVQEPYSALEQLKPLAPGGYATWDGESLSLGTYWSLADSFRNGARPPSREHAPRVLREALDDAVRTHLVSDVPLGVFLSGGIDSTALVGLVTTASGTPPRTVSVIFPEQEFTEKPFIQQVVKRFDTQHVDIELAEDDVLERAERAVRSLDQPSFDGINTFIVSELARGAGLTVALSGLGSDELFGGYDTFRLVPQLERVKSLTPALARRGAASLLRRAGSRSDRQDKLVRWLDGRDVEGSAYALRRELFAPSAADALAPGIRGPDSFPTPPVGVDSENSVSFLELSSYMRNVLLRDADVMSMASSLEVRVPFLDHELVETVAAFPGEWKAFHGNGRGVPKRLLVEALGDLLPPEVVNRPKMGFTLPFVHWMKGPLREDVESALLSPDYGGALAGVLDHDAVEAVWRRFLAGQGHWHRAWALYALKSWGAALQAPKG